MSPNSTCATAEPLSVAEILVLKAGFYQIAAQFVLWGLQIALACYALYVIWKRGLRNSLSRQCMLTMVLVMLASSTIRLMLILKFYIMQTSAMGIDTPPDVMRKVKVYNIVGNWLTRLNYCLSDIIVLWRAWALWPGNRPIQWMLGVFMGVTLCSTTINSVLITVQSQRPSASGETLPPSALRALLYIPLLATNLLATALICYKAWLYHREIRAFSTNTQSSASSFRFPVRLSRIFALFIETGALYLVFFVINILGVYGVFDGTERGYLFHYVWVIIMNPSSCIYPTIIIIFVANYMSQADVVLSSGRIPPHVPTPGNPKSENEDTPIANHRGSTIQFDMLPSPSTLSSTRDEELPMSAHTNERSEEKREELEIVQRVKDTNI